MKNVDNYYPIAFLVINILLSLYFLCRILEALLVGFITTSIAFFGPIYLASCKTLPAVSLFKAPSWQDTRGDNQTQCYMIMSLKPGLLIFRGKKAKFCGIFRGKFAEKSANFAGFSREKSQNSRRNRLILRDFRGRKVKIRGKIGRLRGILAEKSQISKDFQGQIVRKIGRCHEKFWGETSPRNSQ